MTCSDEIVKSAPVDVRKSVVNIVVATIVKTITDVAVVNVVDAMSVSVEV